MKARPLLVLAACCGLVLGLPAFHAGADDWPQWRGPNRDDISRETGLLKTWPKNGPPLLWTYSEAGLGYSGPSVVKGRLYTMGARDKTEYVIALDTQNGKQIWAAPVGD